MRLVCMIPAGRPLFYTEIISMHKITLRLMVLVLGLSLWIGQVEAADFEANTPAVTRLKQSMKQRHSQLELYYDSGAIGFTRDGLIALRDANAVPLSGRQSVNMLVAAENQDR